MPAISFAKCQIGSCSEWAVSFSTRCWAHTEKDDYLARLQVSVRNLGRGSAILNLKKVTGENFDFSHLNLSGSTFSQAHLSNCLFVGTNLTNCDLIGARLRGCDFIGSDLVGANLTRAVLEHCSFSHSDLRDSYWVEARFQEVDLMGTLLANAVLWNADLSGAKHLKKKNFCNPENSQKEASLSEKSAIVAYESYRTMKHYFYDQGLYEDASWAAYRELTMERKHYFETRNGRYLPSLLMDLLSGYTEKPNRVIVSSIVIVLFFGLIYWFFNVPASTSTGIPPRAGLVDSIYFSFITFTTVGYGDFAPRPVAWFRLLACTEAFSGPFMAGLYIFTLTRRYAAS